MEEFEPPRPNAVPLPAADVAAPAPGPANVEYEAYPVRKPEVDLNDFKVQARASTLRRCRERLAAISHSRFPWHEVALGVATLAIGAFLGALPANLIAGSRQAIFFYSVLPVIGVATFVAYFFIRRNEAADVARVVAHVLEEFPDPDKAR